MISVVIPVLNEEENVAPLHAELVSVLKGIGEPYEIIFVDDGSSDSTVEKLSALSPVTIVRLRRRFGQTAALDAGIKEAKGEYIITMDGDGQNDPHDIPRFLTALKEGESDLISGWRKHRRDSFMKKFSSRAAALLRRILLNDGIHDSGCTFKIYKRECFEGIDLTGEMHRFIPALLSIRGFRVTELVVNHRPRTKGVTKYTWSRGIKGALDMLSIAFWRFYVQRPLHLFGTMGLLIMLLSGVAGLMALYGKIALGQDLSDTFLTTLAVVGFMMGLQFVVFGLIADMLSKNYFAATGVRAYSVKDTVRR